MSGAFAEITIGGARDLGLIAGDGFDDDARSGNEFVEAAR
jgi:hypothetical protein